MAAALTIKALNLAKIRARIAALPAAAGEALKQQLKTEVDELVAAQKRAAPVDPDSDNPGNLRDSIHAYPNPDREISFNVIADARDAAGKFIGANIEQGHRTVSGQHVAGRPSFWPTYRARKKGMQRRLGTAARRAVRKAFEE